MAREGVCDGMEGHGGCRRNMGGRLRIDHAAAKRGIMARLSQTAAHCKVVLRTVFKMQSSSGLVSDHCWFVSKTQEKTRGRWRVSCSLFHVLVGIFAAAPIAWPLRIDGELAVEELFRRAF